MLAAISRNWWVLLIRGIGAIAFGLLAFAWPGLTLLTLVLMYAAFTLVDGVAAVVLGIRGCDERGTWWSMILVGVLGILAGLVAFFWPQITALALLYLVATWAIVRGVFEIVAAIRLRKEIDNEWLLGLAGAASILFGGLLIARPGEGLLTLVWLVGVAAVAWGALLIGLSLRLRKLHQRLSVPPSATAKPA